MLRKIRTLFYLRKNKRKSTIYCRISLEKDKTVRSTGLKVDPDDWVQEAQRVCGDAPSAESINESLSVIEHQIREAENNLQSQHIPLTTANIIDVIEGDQKTDTFLEMFFEHNREMKELSLKGEIAEATYTKYCTMEKHTKQFLKDVYDREDIHLHELNLEWVENFEHWFKTVQGISHNTTLKYLKQIKKIVNRALRRGYLRKDPFDGFDRNKKEKTPTFLHLDELHRIESHDFDGLDRLDKVRDMFVFSCYTGLAYSDLAKLDKDLDFYRDSNGEIWLQQNRTKTDEPANLLLLPNAHKIYKKYEHLDTVVPVLSNQKYNAYLKEIATLCKVKKKLTTHVARHTFATTIALGNGLSIETVQILMGHRDRRSTEHYARVTNYKLTSDMMMLKERLIEQMKQAS